MKTPLNGVAGNFLVLPFTLWLGRRPTFLASNIILFIATIGAAVNNGYEGHLTARVFQGIATGATESVSTSTQTEGQKQELTTSASTPHAVRSHLHS